MTTATVTKKLAANLDKMAELYACSRVLRAELDVIEGKTELHTSAKSLVDALER